MFIVISVCGISWNKLFIQIDPMSASNLYFVSVMDEIDLSFAYLITKKAKFGRCYLIFLSFFPLLLFHFMMDCFLIVDNII